MSTHTRTTNQSFASDRFTPVTATRQITADDIATMADPDNPTGDATGTMAFAVGVQAGVVHNVHARREFAATAVLYMTRDERVAERWIPGDLADAPRACIVGVDDLEDAGRAAWLADALDAHPEVES